MKFWRGIRADKIYAVFVYPSDSDPHRLRIIVRGGGDWLTYGVPFDDAMREIESILAGDDPDKQVTP